MDTNDSDFEDDSELEFLDEMIPSYVVISIDTHPGMFIADNSNVTPFRMCLKSLLNLADSLIFDKDSRRRCPFAIVVARKEDVVLVDFKKDLIDTINLLKSKLGLNDIRLKDEFMRDTPLELSNFLLRCKKVFLDVKSSYYKQILLYITNDDKPDSIKDPAGKHSALNEVRQLMESNIEIQVVTTTNTFNYALFYQELYTAIDSAYTEEICQDVDGLTQKLRSTVTLNVSARSIKLYPFQDEPSIGIDCYWHNFTKKNKLLNSTLCTANGEVVIRVVDEEEVEYVCDGVVFTKDEHKKMILDDSTPIGYTLLYISPRITKVGRCISKPALLTNNLKEPNKYFNKFWNSLVRQNRVMVCLEKLREQTTPEYVQLIPVKIDRNELQYGFIVVRLPTSEQIFMDKSKPKRENNEKGDMKEAEVVEELVNKMTCHGFSLDMVEDQQMRLKKEYLKAKLFGLEEPSMEIKDDLADKIDTQLGEDLIQEWLNTFVSEVPKKRGKSGAAATSSRKRIR